VGPMKSAAVNGRTVPASGVFVSVGSPVGLNGRTAPGLGVSEPGAPGMGLAAPTPLGGGSGNPQLPCEPAGESLLGSLALGRVGLAPSSAAAGVR
jgi:hypothetical protein